MFNSGKADPLSMETKSNKVVTVLIDDADAEFVGKSSRYVRAGRVTLKDLDARPFDEKLDGIYQCFSQNIGVDSRCEGAQRCQATRPRTSSS
jgi:hypothetical protein